MDEIQFQQVKMDTVGSDLSQKNAGKDKVTSNQGKNNGSSDIQIISTQLGKLNKLKTGISNMLQKVDQSKHQSQINRQILAKQSSDLQAKISQYQTSLQKSNIKAIQTKIQSNKKSYISMWQNRIAIAETVNVKEFMDVELEDRKSLANELFKWIIVAIYGEAEAKFYWPNFRDQVFEKDYGKDFKERLGKINAANAKEEHVIKVKDFLEKFMNILASEQLENLSNVHKQAEKLRQVAELYLKCHDIAKNTVQLQAQITKDKQMSLQKDEQAMKWKGRHEALQQRIQVIDQYMKSLEQIENSLQQKVKNYQKREQLLSKFESKLRKGQQITSEQLKCLISDEY